VSMESIALKQAVRRVVPRSVRNWLRSPSRSARWLWDSLRFACGTTRVLQISPDWRIVCHPHAYRVLFRDQVTDPEQSAEFRNFQTQCVTGMFLFDIGAHFGVFSLAAARAGGRAIAIDPSPEAMRMIAIQSALNRCSGSIQTMRAAVTSESGNMGLLSSGVFSDGYFKVAENESRGELTTIPGLTIDDLTSQFGAPTHVKIDIEGHEAAALRGGTTTFDRYSPLLFLELHNEMVMSGGGDPTAPLDELARLGYDTFGLNGEVIERRAILEPPIIRIIARRSVA
jgi:FkbM family methyltransferase